MGCHNSDFCVCVDVLFYLGACAQDLCERDSTGEDEGECELLGARVEFRTSLFPRATLFPHFFHRLTCADAEVVRKLARRLRNTRLPRPLCLRSVLPLRFPFSRHRRRPHGLYA